MIALNKVGGLGFGTSVSPFMIALNTVSGLGFGTYVSPIMILTCLW